MPFLYSQPETTSGGLLLALAVLVPFIGLMIGFALGAAHTRRVALLTLLAGLGLSFGIAFSMLQTEATLVYQLGGWSPPLGVALRADGLSVALLLTVAVVVCGIGLYARADFPLPAGGPETRAPFTFWLLLLAVWGSLNLVFVSGDLFTLYVALELLTFSGVPLVCLDGRGETLRSALRYLLFALAGSLLYLLGAVLLYGAYGTLDIALLGAAIRPEPITWVVLALMTCGLLAKTALFPLHIWLPPAHAGAPAAASAILSALVIKGSWFLLIRLWFDVMPGAVTLPAAQLLGALGATAIVTGSVVALQQLRLKLLVAYSTVAQIGYLFLMFPLAYDAASRSLLGGDALTGGVLQGISHATAKASMFMAAGLIYAALGHDRIAELAGVARAMPVTVLAFFLSGVALMGSVPSGTFMAKKLLLDAADASGQTWLTVVLQGGAVFTAAYVILVLTHALRQPAATLTLEKRLSPVAEYAALALALCSLLLALTPTLAAPAELTATAMTTKDLATLLLVLFGGALLAQCLSPRPLFGQVSLATELGWRQRVAALGGAFGQLDSAVRRWAVASINLIMLSILFCALLIQGSNP